MTFAELNDALIPRAEELCTHLFPAGKRQGHEWVIGGVDGQPGESMKIPIEGAKVGRWKDFASDEGGDLIALIAAAKRCQPKEAADFARDFLGLPPWAPDKSAAPPFNPLTVPFKRKGEKVASYGTQAWEYRNEDGTHLCYVVRLEFPDGKKDVLPMRQIDGRHWWKGFPKPEKRPIYGLDKLAKRPDAPVLIVEGEKTADAATRLFPDHVCITWLGGCKAVRMVEWSPVLDRTRKVVLWPDADEPGRKAMNYLRQLIEGSHMVKTKQLPEGWDVADPAPEDIDVRGLLDAAMLDRAPSEAEREEAEEEDIYRLPRGCELSKVEAHILKYGVFEYGNRVWSIYDQRGQRGKWATEVSNFTVAIHQHITTKDGPLALITINNGSNEPVTTDVSFDIFSTELSFKKAVRGFTGGNYQWFGIPTAFENYVRYLMDHMGSGRIITELGGQPEGFFVFNNAMVNGSVTMLSKHGTFSHGGSKYYVPSGNQYYKDDAGEFSVQKMLVYRESKVTFGEWQQQMVKVHREHAFMASCFAVATAFSGYIFERLRSFPVMFLYGPGGSGKDQLIQGCQALFGQPQPEISLTNPNTDKGLIKMFDEFADVIMNLAEYKPRMKRDMNELLKNLWGRIGYRMAAMQGKRTVTMGIRCSAMVSGNYYPTGNDALVTRLLIEPMLKADHNDKAEEHYAKLREMIEEGYSHLLADILRHRPEFMATWHQEHYRPARALLMEALGDTKVDSRIPSNMQVLVGTYTFFRDKLEWGFTLDQLLAHMAQCMAQQQAKRGESNDVSAFWSAFIHAVISGKLRRDQHFRIMIPEDTIMFYWQEVYGAYAWACKDMGIPQDQIVDSTSLRGKLQEHPCWLGPKDSVYIGKRKSSAYKFRMSETGTNLVKLLDPDSKFAMEEEEETNAISMPF